MAFPAGAVVREGNPLCYMSSPGCFEDGAATCARDEEQFCAACEGTDCPAVEDADAAFDASALDEVKLSSGDDDSSSSAGVVASFHYALAGVIALVYMTL